MSIVILSVHRHWLCFLHPRPSAMALAKEEGTKMRVAVVTGHGTNMNSKVTEKGPKKPRKGPRSAVVE